LPLLDLTNLVVVMVRPRNPLNIGAAARAMSNFGSRHLRVVNPFRLAFREARSAVGGSAVLRKAEEFDSVADAVADCALVVGTTAVRDRKLDPPPKALNGHSARIIHSILQQGRVALLFGSEKIGLTNDDFSHCHWLMTIRTHSQNISMNLGLAVAVCLYEHARHPESPTPAEKRELPSAEQLEHIAKGLLEALHISGYVKPGTDKMFEKKARQLILKMNLAAHAPQLLLGKLPQILWKLRQSKKASG
jgi:TrmH family RNA methyltransferase